MSSEFSSQSGGFTDPLAPFDTHDPKAVVQLLADATSANLDANCRVGCIDRVQPIGALLATGDLHDNPLNFARVVQLARLDASTADQPRHITLHEVIHGSTTMGIDFSHRALLRVAALKRLHPELVHTLLANHELSQIVGAGIVKDGVRVVDAFNEGVEQVYADEAPRVEEAINAFIRSMPLALISQTDERQGVLCAHSLPSPGMMSRFDTSVFDRRLADDDYEPRTGSAHLMVWGRHHKPEQLESLAAHWGVSLFVLGHQQAESGWAIAPPNTVILNSDHARGVALRINLASPPTTPAQALEGLEPLGA